MAKTSSGTIGTTGCSIQASDERVAASEGVTVGLIVAVFCSVADARMVGVVVSKGFVSIKAIVGDDVVVGEESLNSDSVRWGMGVVAAASRNDQVGIIGVDFRNVDDDEEAWLHPANVNIKAIRRENSLILIESALYLEYSYNQ
jgi:hypothetical protein